MTEEVILSQVSPQLVQIEEAVIADLTERVAFIRAVTRVSLTFVRGQIGTSVRLPLGAK